MPDTLPPPVLLAGSACLAAFALGVWFVFLRPVPRHQATGVITAKRFKAATTFTRFPAGERDGFTTQTPIPIAEAHIVTIQADGIAEPLHFTLNSVMERLFPIGQPVVLQYEVRGIPGLWPRIMVVELDRRPVAE